MKFRPAARKAVFITLIVTSLSLLTINILKVIQLAGIDSCMFNLPYSLCVANPNCAFVRKSADESLLDTYAPGFAVRLLGYDTNMCV